MNTVNYMSKNVENLSCDILIAMYKKLSEVYKHDRSTTDAEKKEGLETGDPPYYGVDKHEDPDLPHNPDFNRQVIAIEQELLNRCGNGETDISKILQKHGLDKIEIRE